MTQPLPTALDQLLIKPVAQNGTPLPSRRYFNLLGNVSCADNPTFVDPNTNEIVGSTDVTIGTPNTVENLIALAAAIPSANLTIGARYLVDNSSGGFTQSLPTTSLRDGQWYEFTDSTGQWSTGGSKNLTINGGSIQVVDPNSVGFGWATSTSVTCKTVGETFRFTYSQARSLWLVK